MWLRKTGLKSGNFRGIGPDIIAGQVLLKYKKNKYYNTKKSAFIAVGGFCYLVRRSAVNLDLQALLRFCKSEN